MFLLFLNGLSETSLSKEGIKSCIYESNMPIFTLYMNESLCCCLLCDRFAHPYFLYRFFNDTDLVNPVKSPAASFGSFVVLLGLVQSNHSIQLIHILQ